MKKTKIASKKMKSPSGKYVLQLFFANHTPRSILAIANLKEICDERLDRRCDIKLIDLYKNRPLAKSERIVAIPTLIKKLPLPERRVIGDLSDTKRVLSGLGLKAS
jgi:circadian clock protein KaiB